MLPNALLLLTEYIYTLPENELKCLFRVNKYSKFGEVSQGKALLHETYLKTPLPIPHDFSQFLRDSAFAHVDIFSSADRSHVSIFAGVTKVTRSVVLAATRSGPLHFNFSLMNKPNTASCTWQENSLRTGEMSIFTKIVILTSVWDRN